MGSLAKSDPAVNIPGKSFAKSKGLIDAFPAGKYVTEVTYWGVSSMPVKVYFASLKADMRRNLLSKIDRLCERIGLPKALSPGLLTAVKCHFGEHGNTAYLRPDYVRQVIENIQRTGAHPFVTDTSTLYRGSRGDAIKHLLTAAGHGFNLTTLGAPVIIADGLRSQASVSVKIAGRHFTEVTIAEAIARADALVSVSHFKLHEATGFGGAIKNLGMGCAPREGKLKMHSSVRPHISRDLCTGDGICVRACTFGAIELREGVACIDLKKCSGCAECLGVCPHGAIGIKWNQALQKLGEYMAEYALGAVTGKEDRCFHISLATQISPACDCYPMNDRPIVPDLGFFASTDPVALDQACLDALQQAPGHADSVLKNALAPGTDKIADVYPKAPYQAQLNHAELIGLGRRKYHLTTVD